MASWYSVSLFILCSGCGVFYNRNRKRSYIHYVSKVSSFLLQYAIATFFVLIFDSKGFDLKTYINHVLNFSAQGPYYFVLFYIQLVLVTPILITWYNFCEIRKSSIIYHIITLGVITVLSSLSIKYTFMLNVHGGGKNLLGGTYFLLYYLGICLAPLIVLPKRISLQFILSLIFIALTATWLVVRYFKYVAIDSYFVDYFGPGWNPPGVEQMVFAILILFGFGWLFIFLENLKVAFLTKILKVIAYIGKLTLFIFLYHLLVKQVLVTYLQPTNQFVCFVIFVMIILLPVIFITIERKIKKVVTSGAEVSVSPNTSQQG